MFHLSFLLLLLLSLSSLGYKVSLSFGLMFFLMSVFLLKAGQGQRQRQRKERPSAPEFETLLRVWRQQMLENVSVSAAFPPLHSSLHGVFCMKAEL